MISMLATILLRPSYIKRARAARPSWGSGIVQPQGIAVISPLVISPPTQSRFAPQLKVYNI